MWTVWDNKIKSEDDDIVKFTNFLYNNFIIGGMNVSENERILQFESINNNIKTAKIVISDLTRLKKGNNLVSIIKIG